MAQGSEAAIRQFPDGGRLPAFAERAAKLAQLFALTAAEHDRTGVLPADNFVRLHEAGLLALPAPVSLGGEGAGLGASAEVIRTIARGEPSTALILAMQYLNLAALAGERWPRHLAARAVGDAVESGALINSLRVEPELGTPLRGGLPDTIARRTDEGWSISGRKIYSTGSTELRWMIVWARTDEQAPRVGRFLVPAPQPGIAIEPTWNPLGMRATASHDVVFEHARIPLDHAVDIRPPQEWTGREAGQGAWNVVLIGSVYDGIARAARAWLLGFLRERRPSNLGAPLASLPRIQEAVGEIEQLLIANERLLRSVAVEVDAGTPPDSSITSLIKLTVTENAIAVVEKALRLTGNHGVSRANPLERHYRDVLCGRIHSPQEDTARLNAGRLALEV